MTATKPQPTRPAPPNGPVAERARARRQGIEPLSEYPRRRRLRTAAGVLVLIWLGLLLEAALLALWPISYDLTQGADFSYEYLLQYEPVWEFFRPMLERFGALFPTAASSLEQLTVMLSLFWVVSFALYFTAFLVLRSLPGGWWPVVPIVLFTLLFQVTLFLMPGTFTTDLFSYAMYGIIPRVYDLNPYIYVPGYFPDNRMTNWIHPIWYYTPSIYGPLWLDLSVWLTGLVRERSLVDHALIYRLTSNVAHLLNLALIGLLLRRLAPKHAMALFLLAAWNPLLLFEFAASGHNDSVMMVFVLLAALLVAYRQHLLAVVALSLAAMIKIVVVLVLPLLLVYWAACQRGLARQLGTLVGGGMVFLAVAIALYLPWYAGPDTFLLFEYWSKGPMYLNYLPDLLALTIADQVLDPGLLDQATSWETARTWVKWVTRVIFVGYFLWELWRLYQGPRRPTSVGAAAVESRELLAAMSRVFIVFLLLVNTWVLAWYLTWPFMLAVALGWRQVLTRVLTAFTFTAPVMMYNHHYWSIHMAPWMYALYASPLLLAAWEVARRVARPERRARRQRPGHRPRREDRETAPVAP